MHIDVGHSHFYHIKLINHTPTELTNGSVLIVHLLKVGYFVSATCIEVNIYMGLFRSNPELSAAPEKLLNNFPGDIRLGYPSEDTECLFGAMQTARLFDGIPDIVYIVKDMQGCYLAANDTTLIRIGAKRWSDILGRPVKRLLPEPMADRYAQQDDYICQTSLPVMNSIDRTVLADRTHGWCVTHKFPLFNRNRRLIGIVCMSRDIGDSRLAAVIDESFAKAVDQILMHYEKPIKVHDLADIAGISMRSFDRRIQRIFGHSPSEFILHTRVAVACRLLRRNNGAIAEIAARCGFYDQSRFSRLFRRTVGITPTMYREMSLLH